MIIRKLPPIRRRTRAERLFQKLTSNNAKFVVSPAFIPFWPYIQKEYKLTDKATLLYGFIRFFLQRKDKLFYFTNDQLSTVLNCNEKTIKRSISMLKENGLVEIKHSVKAGGGRVRCITKIRTNVSRQGMKSALCEGYKMTSSESEIKLAYLPSNERDKNGPEK